MTTRQKLTEENIPYAQKATVWLEAAGSATYAVFVRSWYRSSWRRTLFGPTRTLEPHAGRKTYIARHVSLDQAIALCKAYNTTHKPGLRSRKAEFERE